MNRPIRVLCLGGGWVAIALARSLRRAIRSGRVELTVVSRDNYQTTHGLIPEMLTCKVQPEHVLNPLRSLLAPAHLLNLEIVEIDTTHKAVLTRHPPDGCPKTLTYDHLVLGMGSVQAPARHLAATFALKTFPECCRLRSHLLSVLERAALETDPEERRRLLTFVIAGGNYAGIEVACELADYFRLLRRKIYPQIPAEAVRIVVVEMGAQILSELSTRHPRLLPYAERRLAALGLDIRLKTGLACATPEEAVLTSGESLPTRTIINCTGTVASSLLTRLPCSHDGRGRIETDGYLHVPGIEGLWAAGDCAAVPHPNGGVCPPLALYAQRGGRQIGINILCTLESRPLRRYRFTGLGEACTLGHRCAVAQMKGIPAYGLFAWLGWRLILWTLFMPGWERKVRLACDWLQTALLGRDTVNLKAK